MTRTMKSQTDRDLLALASRVGAFRPRDVEALGVPRRRLYELVERGELAAAGRGLYRLPRGAITENHSLVEVAKRVPRGVVCLLSALRFHELTTELPAEVWIAIPSKAWAPTFKRPRLRVVRFSGPSLMEGVEEHVLEGIPVRVYGVAKTVADCFKFRNKIGTGVAVEALRDAWTQRKTTADDVWRYATVCRVNNVMRPYLESLT
jgi:predicted transcriptional regulator of viral defense system